MDNSRIINITLKFQTRLRSEIEKGSVSDNLTSTLSRVLEMTEIAYRSFQQKIKIKTSEKQYFDRYVAVARYFRDWGLDWVADTYFEISHYIGKYYWPDNDKSGLEKDYKPFSRFQLEE